MNRTFMAATLVALLVACARPATVAPPTQPFKVSVNLSESRPDQAELQSRWARALESRLAVLGARSTPSGGGAPTPELRVTVKATMARGDVVKRSATRAFGASVKEGTEVATQEDPHPRQFIGGALVGALVGVVVAPVAATATEGRALFHNARLGYKPRHLVCTVTFHPVDQPEEIILETSGWEVIKAMRPLTEAEVRSPGALAEEEARALAQVVGEALERDHHWTPRPRFPQP